MQVKRFDTNPIIVPELDERILKNINGPAMIRVPDWVKNPLGRYYLYFAHHQGQFIRMAYADDIRGPYTVYSPGVLAIEDAPFRKHVASPDVHVDDENQVIFMYYHGSGPTKETDYRQATCYAESEDGLLFVTDQEYLGPSYLKVVQYDGWHYGFQGGGARLLHRSRGRREVFEPGIQLEIEGETFEENVVRTRHPDLVLRGHELEVYYSAAGDIPERIKMTRVDLREEWSNLRGSAYVEVLQSEMDYEGVDLPKVASSGGASHVPVHEVRDPEIFEEDGKRYLFYTVAGECGIGGAELID